MSGTIVECKVRDNTISGCGTAGTSGNREGIAFRDSGAGAVTDWWCENNVIWEGGTLAETKGHGIYGNSPDGVVVRGNHLYGIGMDGIHLTGSSECRVVENYVEYFGQLASTGDCYGIFSQDAGSGQGTVITGNCINIDGAVTGNTFVAIAVGNVTSNGPAYYTIGANCMWTAVAAATAFKMINTGGASNFMCAMAAQMAVGFTAPYVLDDLVKIIGSPFQGWQQPTTSATMSIDPTLGTNVTIVFNSGQNITMDLPAYQWGGLVLNITFQQPASGTTTNTVTFTNSGGNSLGGLWENVTFTAKTGANAFSCVSFASDGYDLVQIA